MTISAATKLTAVVGNPVRHSLSPVLHNTIYANEKVDAVMLAFENASIETLVGAIRALPIGLTAVTIPHKQKIIPLLDEVDPVATAIGAVNTVVNRAGKLYGYNTDVVGFAHALKDVPLKGKNVLLLGAGGAAHTAAYHLQQAGANMFCYNRRDAEQAKVLCRDFSGTAIPLEAIRDYSFDVIVNATPVGMAPNSDASPIEPDIIRPGATVFDFIYTPLKTRLLKDAAAKGARAISGLGMLVAQGIEQERLWLGREIKDDCYTELLENELLAHTGN